MRDLYTWVVEWSSSSSPPGTCHCSTSKSRKDNLFVCRKTSMVVEHIFFDWMIMCNCPDNWPQCNLSMSCPCMHQPTRCIALDIALQFCETSKVSQVLLWWSANQLSIPHCSSSPKHPGRPVVSSKAQGHHLQQRKLTGTLPADQKRKNCTAHWQAWFAYICNPSCCTNPSHHTHQCTQIAHTQFFFYC